MSVALRRNASEGGFRLWGVSFGEALAVEVLGGGTTAGLLGILVARRDGLTQAKGNLREVVALTEDAERFIRDRDRLLRVELSAASDRMAGRGMTWSGSHLGQLADLKRQALQEYRDEMNRKLRRYDDLCDAHPTTVLLVLGRPERLPSFELSDVSRRLLESWRADATVSGMDGRAPVDDPTSEEREPRLRRFEREGARCDEAALGPLLRPIARPDSETP